MTHAEFTLLDWVDEKKLHIDKIGENSSAAMFILDKKLYKYMDKKAIDAFMNNLVKFETNDMKIYHILSNEKNNKQIMKSYWMSLSSYDSSIAFDILRRNANRINWVAMSRNSSDYAIELLGENTDKISWIDLHYNKNNNVHKLFLKFPHKIKWNLIGVHNSSNGIMGIVINNMDKIQTLDYYDTAEYKFRHISEDKILNLIYFHSLDDIYDAIINYKQLFTRAYWELLFNLYGKINSSLFKHIPLKYVQVRKNWASCNEDLIDLIKMDESLISWKHLSGNTHPYAIQLLSLNTDKINYGELTKNSAIFQSN